MWHQPWQCLYGDIGQSESQGSTGGSKLSATSRIPPPPHLHLPQQGKCLNVFLIMVSSHQRRPRDFGINFKGQGFPLRGEEGGSGEPLPLMPKISKIYPSIKCPFHQKIEFSPFVSCPSVFPLIICYIGYIGKKVTLIAFRQILHKISPVLCIFRSTLMTYLKKLAAIKSIKGQL